MRVNLAAAVLLLFSTAGQTQTFAGTNLGNIPDGAGPGPANYGAPRDVEFDVTGTTGTVGTVSLSFGAAHPWVGDLKVSLIAPDGTNHLLFERTGSTTSNDGGSSSNLVGTNTYAFADSFSTNWWTAAGSSGLDIPSANARTVIGGGAGVSNPPQGTSQNSLFTANHAWCGRLS